MVLTLLDLTALCIGEYQSPIRAIMFAPFSTKILTISRFLACATIALDKSDLPAPLDRLRLAPFAIRHCTTSNLPL